MKTWREHLPPEFDKVTIVRSTSGGDWMYDCEFFNHGQSVAIMKLVSSIVGVDEMIEFAFYLMKQERDGVELIRQFKAAL